MATLTVENFFYKKMRKKKKKLLSKIELIKIIILIDHYLAKISKILLPLTEVKGSKSPESTNATYERRLTLSISIRTKPKLILKGKIYPLIIAFS